MTAYTRESPFEFEGVKVWRNTGGLVRYDHLYLDATVIAQAMHAFIKAERSPYEPVPFADIKVGDTIKSVSPCGTVRKGVVASIDKECGAKDANGDYFARPSWTLSRRTPKPPKAQFSSGLHVRLTKGVGSRAVPVCDTCINELGLNIRWDQAPCRRTPKPAKFVPLDVPAPKQWITFTLRNGHQYSGAPYCTVKYSDGSAHVYITGFLPMLINAPKPMRKPTDIISWRPTTPPAPPEPTGWGLVGHVTDPDGRVFSVYRRAQPPERYMVTSHNNGLPEFFKEWRDIHNLGTFTAVSR